MNLPDPVSAPDRRKNVKKAVSENHHMIRTERLTIRRICEDDWKAVQALWADAAGSPYAQYDRPNDLDDQSVYHRIRKWASYKDSDEHIFLAVCLQNALIGYVVLHAGESSFEMGYCFHSDYHGKGYAGESISAVLGAMKERNALRITAGTALNNTPSVRLLTALGFRLTGTEKVSFYRDEKGRDITFDGGNFELSL